MLPRASVLAVLAAAIAATVAAAVAAPAASTRDTFIRYRVENRSAPAGLDVRNHRATASITVPAAWPRQRSSTSARLVVRSGRAGCRYTITFRTRQFVGRVATAAEIAEDRVKGRGPYVLETGARRSAAWRVVRIPAPRATVEVRAVRIAPAPAPPAGRLPAGRRLWREVSAIAKSGANDECHSGTYRDVVGPGIGDALATERGRSYAF
jgi:hypothetical protein